MTPSNKLLEIKMQTLTLSTGSFDQENTFTVEVKGFKRMKTIDAKLFRGYQEDDDGIYWAMQRSACLKAEYTAKDYEERDRLNAMEPLRNGDLVNIDGQVYKAKVLGDYSNCVVFEPA